MFSSFSKKVVLVVLVLLCTVAAIPASCATTYINLAMSWTALLSGGLTSCATPSDVNATDCEGGLAAADAYVRQYINSSNEPLLYSPTLDRQSPFVQMHPDTYGVNRKTFRTIIGNYTHFRATHAVLTATRNLTYLQNADLPFLLTNALVPPSSTWTAYWKTVFFDTATKIALLSVQSGSQPNSFDSFGATRAALEIIHQRSDPPWYPIILFDDSTINFTDFISYATDLTRVSLKPTAIIRYETTAALSQVNGTWIGGFSSSGSKMIRYRFGVDLTVTSSSTASSASETTYSLKTLPWYIKDFTYVSQISALRAEALLATTNDPVVGFSQLMPITRIGDIRMCMAGECPLGNLFTSAFRWAGDADIAFEGSGGVRGTGWNSGSVKISDIWGALPFANTLGVGKISGVTLYKLFNHSTALATFTSTKSEFGDRLLQNSGLKVTYNTQLDPSVGRLLSIEVLDRATNTYKPVERLKIYKFATSSFVCQAFDPYPAFLNAAEITGEVACKVQDRLVQELVGDYLTSLKPNAFDTSYQGRLRNDTTSAASSSPMASLVHTAATCGGDSYWTVATQTCSPCPEDQYQPNPNQGATSCELRSKDYTVIAVAIAVPVALLIVAALIFFSWRREQLLKENFRDLENAPMNPPVTVIFTDIQESTRLWSAAPLSMSWALENHSNIVRGLIAKHKGFEVKNLGDSFFIATSSAQDGAALVADIQREMMKAPAPLCINQVYDATTDEQLAYIDDDPNELVDPSSFEKQPTFHGLRIRIGLVVGFKVEAKKDEVSKSIDYFGPSCNLSARAEAAAQGGQILVDSESVDLIDAAAINCMFSSCGEFALKGIPDSLELFMLNPIEFSGRQKYFAGSKKSLSASPAAGGAGGGDMFNAGGDDHHSEIVSSVASSETGDGLDGLQLQEDITFMNALLKTVKPKEKEQIVQMLENSWRIRKYRNSDETLAAVAKRVSRVKTSMQEQEDRRNARLGIHPNKNTLHRVSSHMGSRSPSPVEMRLNMNKTGGGYRSFHREQKQQPQQEAQQQVEQTGVVNNNNNNNNTATAAAFAASGSGGSIHAEGNVTRGGGGDEHNYVEAGDVSLHVPSAE